MSFVKQIYPRISNVSVNNQSVEYLDLSGLTEPSNPSIGGRIYVGIDRHLYYSSGTSFVQLDSSTVNWSDSLTSNLIPDTDDAYDLGNGTYRFRDIYFSDNIKIGNDRFLTYGVTNTNIFLGLNSGNLTGTGGNNVILGNVAGVALTDGTNNVLLGYQTGDAIRDGIGNIFIGGQSGSAVVSGNYSVGIGYQTLLLNKSTSIIAIGESAARDTIASAYGIFIGYQAGLGNGTTTNGQFNISIGAESGKLATSAHNNINFGYKTGYSNLTGSYNINIGQHAGYNETGSNKLYIHSQSTTTATSLTSLVYGEFDNHFLRFNASIVISGMTAPSPQTGLLYVDTDKHLYYSSGDTFFQLDTGGDFLSINSNIIPSINNTYNIGSSNYAWKDLYLTGTTYTNTIMEFNTDFGVTIDYVLLKDSGITLGTGPAVNTIQTTISDSDTSIPTSGAVIDAISQSTLGWINASGTPLVNQIAMFIDTNTIEGQSGLTWNGSTFIVTGTTNTDTLVANNYLSITNTEGYLQFAGNTVRIGYGISTNTGTTNSILIGYNTGVILNEGDNNIAIGTNTLSQCDNYSNNVVIGYGAGTYANASNNTFIGYRSGLGVDSLTTGDNNTAVGYDTLYTLTTGTQNTIFGGYAATILEDGSYNTIIGYQSGFFNTGGTYNVMLGFQSGYNNEGNLNVFIGNQAGYNEVYNNKLYISNSNADSTGALIYGEFDTPLLRINAPLIVPTISGNVGFSDVVTFSGQTTYVLDTLNDTGINTNCNNGNIHTVTLTGNSILNLPTNSLVGSVHQWIITQDAGGTNTLNLTAFTIIGTTKTISTVSNAISLLIAVYNGSNWIMTIST